MDVCRIFDLSNKQKHTIMKAATIIKTNEGTITNYYFDGVKRETEKAVLVDIFQVSQMEDSQPIASSKQVWMPKSAIQINGDNLTVAEWLAAKVFWGFARG